MAQRQILTADKKVLRQRARDVKRVTPEIKALLREMLDTMHEAPGIGLAANQIGLLERLVVIELPEEEDEPLSGKPLFLINPEIVSGSGVQIGEEACLSLPGYAGEVKRYEEVTVKALAENGRPVRIKAHGMLAKVLQHEIDHLNGTLYIDRLTAPDKLYKVKLEAEETAEELDEKEGPVAEI
jgi:peptide deformylase